MLFSLGLNLTPPWKVVKSEFLVPETSTVRELHLWIDFERGSCFMSSKGTLLSPHDTVDKVWRHLNFFEHHHMLSNLRCKIWAKFHFFT